MGYRWVNYGQVRNCAGGKVGTPPVINLACSPSASGTTVTVSSGASILDQNGNIWSLTATGQVNIILNSSYLMLV